MDDINREESFKNLDVIDNSNVSKPETVNFPKNSTDLSVGFKTCSGKEIKVSKSALEKANELMFGCDDDDDDDKISCNKKKSNGEDVKSIEESKINCGFSTARGLKVSISKKSLEKAKELMSEINEDENFISTNLISNKSTEIFKSEESKKENEKSESKSSDETKEKITNFPNKDDDDGFRNILSKNGGKNENFAFFFSASGEKVLVSKEALNKAKKLLAEECDQDDEYFKKERVESSSDVKKHRESSSKDFFEIGFKTGLGHKVEVTEDALKKAKNLFKDCDKSFQNNFGEDSIKKLNKYNLDDSDDVSVITPEPIESSSINTPGRDFGDSSSMYKPVGTSTPKDFHVNRKKKLSRKWKSDMENIEGDVSSSRDTSTNKSVARIQRCAFNFKLETIAESDDDDGDARNSKGSGFTMNSSGKNDDEHISKKLRLTFDERENLSDITEVTPSGQSNDNVKKRKQDFDVEGESTNVKDRQCKKIKGPEDVDEKVFDSEEIHLDVKEERYLARASQEQRIKNKEKVTPIRGTLTVKKSEKNRPKLAEMVKHLVGENYYKKNSFIKPEEALNYKFSTESNTHG